MPPRTRTRQTKAFKENVEVKKSKLKSDGKVTKSARKALADKTNSVSDDNASIDIPIKAIKTTFKGKVAKANADENDRPKRERRLPPRYVENQVLKNLSNSKDSPVKQNPVTSKDTLSKKAENLSISVEASLKGKKTQSYPEPGKKSVDSTNSALKISSKDENRPKADKPSNIIEKLLSSSDIQSNNDKSPTTTDKPANNGKTSITTKGISSKDERITAATRPKRNCRLEAALKKPISSDSSLDDSSPFKTPSKDLESSLIANRPKRICRLPSKFEDHSISPNKFIPVQPFHSSTPNLQWNAKTVNKNAESDKAKKADAKNSGRVIKAVEKVQKSISKVTQTTKLHKVNARTNSSNRSVDKSSPDTNNNGNNKIRKACKVNITTTQTKKVSPESNKIKPFAKRLLEKSLSFRVFEDKIPSEGKDDVYEFTFDPNEEPAPRKKKRKRTVKKKPAKPKMVQTIELKSNYNDNISKALANLKNKVKPSQPVTVQISVKPTDNIVAPIAAQNAEKVQSTEAIAKPATKPVTKDLNVPQINNYSVVNITPAMPINESGKNSIHESNYASIRVEDIAADFEASDHQDDINYSPVNSPAHPATPNLPVKNDSQISAVLNKDPLNLQGDLSFFDENPVASSSMNISVRHPLASPWRVDFGNLPVKWHSNTYVKPNMTPAVECSFIQSEEMSKKKHVYTNMLPDTEPLPETVDNNAPNLKQPGIISFMREVAERSANKKKRRRSPSPTKTNSIFEDIINTSNDFGYKSPKKAKKTAKDSTPNVSNDSNHKIDDKENSNQSNKSETSTKKLSEKNHSPAEAKKKDKDHTYFGFDESENLDQENVSPVKIIPNTRARGLRSRAVLQDLNTQACPTRAVLLIVAKPKLTSSEVEEQLFDQLKSAEDAPQLPEEETPKEPADDIVNTNVEDPSCHDEDSDSQSVHLFEDIDVVHHLKVKRKSYGKAKKVTFRQPSSSDSDIEPRAVEDQADFCDDLADLTFQIPNVKQKKTIKKKKPKKQLSKKEEKEVEEWAAGFNSMCEDIDEFPLLVE